MLGFMRDYERSLVTDTDCKRLPETIREDERILEIIKDYQKLLEMMREH